MYAASEGGIKKGAGTPTGGLCCLCEIHPDPCLPQDMTVAHASATDSNGLLELAISLLMVTYLLVPGGQVSPCWEVAAGSFNGR